MVERGREPRTVRLLHFLVSCFWWSLQGVLCVQLNCNSFQKLPSQTSLWLKDQKKGVLHVGRSSLPGLPLASSSILGEECKNETQAGQETWMFRTTLFSALPLQHVLWGGGGGSLQRMGTRTFLLEGSPLPRKPRWAVALRQDQPSLQMAFLLDDVACAWMKPWRKRHSKMCCSDM